MPQILNNDFNVFSLSNFCHQSLILVFTANTGCVFTFTAISEFCHSQPLFMITSILTMFCGQQAFIPESTSFAGLSLDSNWDQGGLWIPFFHSKIKNQSWSSTDNIRGQMNHRRTSSEIESRGHPQKESDHSNYR